MRFETKIGDETIEITLQNGEPAATVNGKKTEFDYKVSNTGRHLLRIGNRVFRIDNITKNGKSVEFTFNGEWVQAEVKNDQDLLLEKLGFKTDTAESAGTLNAPMPGKILELLVKEGDTVELGEPVAILEAMKMENELKAPASGTISSVSVSENMNVEKNQRLLEITPRG